MASASEEWKEKRRLVFARLDAKNAERSALRREREADAGESGSQATDAFWASLNVIADGLRADIAAVLSGTLPLDASPAKAVTDGWASQFEAARQCVADGSRGLPPYDAEASQQLLGRLREEIDGARSKVTPKRKFAFGRRRQREQAAAPSPAPAEPSPGAAAPAAAASAALLARLGEEEVTVAGKRGEVVELGAESGAGGASCGDVRLMDMEDCTVVVTRRLSALRVDRLKRCTLLCVPVAGSLLLHDCEDCVVHMAARQFRLHRSVGCSFLVLALSRPIIEHCTGLRFGPYLLAPAPGQSCTRRQRELLVDAGLLQSTSADSEKDVETAGNWARVDDFGWIKSTASPNWACLPRSEWPTELPESPAVSGVFSLLTDPLGAAAADCLSPPKLVEPESDVAAAAPTAGATGAAAAASLAAGHDASAAAASRAAGGDADDDDDEL